MRSKKLLILFSLVFIFIGGHSAQAQRSYKSAAGTIKLGGKTIIAKSEAYLNSMPTVVDQNQKRDCSKNGNLIAPVTIQTDDRANLPRGITVRRIWIRSGVFWQQFNFNANETSVKAEAISAIGRTCPNAKIIADQAVKVVIEIRYKNKSYFVSTDQTKLEKVY